MDFALRGDDPFPWLGDSEYFRALADDAVATNAKILGHIWGVDLGVGESLNLKCGIGRAGGVFDCDGGAWCGMDDECRAGIHVDIFEADIAIEDEGGIFGSETPGAGSGYAAQGVW